MGEKRKGNPNWEPVYKNGRVKSYRKKTAVNKNATDNVRKHIPWAKQDDVAATSSENAEKKVYKNRMRRGFDNIDYSNYLDNLHGYLASQRAKGAIKLWSADDMRTVALSTEQWAGGEITNNEFCDHLAARGIINEDDPYAYDELQGILKVHDYSMDVKAFREVTVDAITGAKRRAAERGL